MAALVAEDVGVIFQSSRPFPWTQGGSVVPRHRARQPSNHLFRLLGTSLLTEPSPEPEYGDIFLATLPPAAGDHTLHGDMSARMLPCLAPCGWSGLASLNKGLFSGSSLASYGPMWMRTFSTGFALFCCFPLITST